MRRDHDDYDLLYEGDGVTIKAYALVTGESFKAGRSFFSGPSIVWLSEMPHGTDISEHYVDEPTVWAWLQAQLEQKNKLEEKLKDLGEEEFVEGTYKGLQNRQDELIEERPSRTEKVDELTEADRVESLVRTRVQESAQLLEDLGMIELADRLDDINRDIGEELAESV